MVVLLPFMHPALCSPGLPPGIRFFNPGLNLSERYAASEERNLFFTPEDLPMDSRAAARYVRDAVAFGQGFKAPRDLASLAAGGVEDFYTGTSMNIQSELRSMERGDKAEEEQREALGSAQALLLFAWTFEQAQAEAVALEDKYQQGYAKLRTNLGLDEDDMSELGAITPSDGDVELEAARSAEEVRRDVVAGWRGIFEAMAAFLPEDVQLASLSAEITADLEEFGLRSVSAQGHPWEGENVRMVQAPGWRISGRKSLPTDKPWLAGERTVFLLASSG